MKFEVFGKLGCAKCESAKAKLNHLVVKAAANADVAFVDMSTVEGMAEGAFNDVHQIPTVIARSDTGESLARWVGQIPPAVEVQAFLGAARSPGRAP